MKKTYVNLVFILTLPLICFSQPKQKAEKKFLNELNFILKNSKAKHWEYKGTML